MQRGSVREDLECREVTGRAEPGRFHPVDADLLARGHRLGESELLELGVEPRLGDQVSGGCGTDLLGELGEVAMLLGGENPLLDAQFTQRDLEYLEVGDFVHHGLDRPIVIVICGRGRETCVYFLSCYLAASSHRSGSSVRRVSVDVPV